MNDKIHMLDLSLGYSGDEMVYGRAKDTYELVMYPGFMVIEHGYGSVTQFSEAWVPSDDKFVAEVYKFIDSNLNDIQHK